MKKTKPETNKRPLWQTRGLWFWIVIVSVAVHFILLIVLRPWAQTTMQIDLAEEEIRTQEVKAREKLRSESEKARRQKAEIPEEHREDLKKQAEKKEAARIKKKLAQMLQDREKALADREEAFQEMKKRKKEDYLKRHVVEPLEKEVQKQLDKIVEDFTAAKPAEKKDAEDLAREEKAKDLAETMKEEVKALAENPENHEEHLDKLEEAATEMKKIAAAERERGAATHEPAWELANKSNEVNLAVEAASKEAAEAEQLNDTSGAEQIAEVPEAVEGLASAGAEEEGPEGGTQTDGSQQTASSESGKQGGGETSAAELYDAAKAVEKQVEQAVRDTRAAEMAMTTGTSFPSAKAKVSDWSPERPDLSPAIDGLQTGTIGELNSFRNAVQQAANETSAMAVRTSAMTGGLTAAAAASGQTAGTESSTERAAESTGIRVEGGGIGSSHGTRFSTDAETGKMEGKKRGDVELELPEEMVYAESLPGRMLTSASMRKGWLYIDTWYVIGPWPIDYKRKFDVIFPPEYQVDFDAVYTDGKFKDKPDHADHAMRWQFVQSDEIRVQPPRVYSSAVYYAFTEIYSDETREMLLAAASDDRSKIWLNDQVVWEDPVESGWAMGEAYRRVTLRKGYNRLLMRIENGPAHCVWSVLLCPPGVEKYVKAGK